MENNNFNNHTQIIDVNAEDMDTTNSTGFGNDDEILGAIGDMVTGPYGLTAETFVIFKLNSGVTKKIKVNDLIGRGTIKSLEDAFNYAACFIRTGRGFIDNNKSQEERVEDKVLRDIQAMEEGNRIEHDRREKVYYRDYTSNTINARFFAKSHTDAQELKLRFMKYYNVPAENMRIIDQTIDNRATHAIIIKNLPTTIYNKIQANLTFRNAADEVAGFTERTANGAINGADLIVNDVAVPVAKTAIKTTAKVGKGVIGLAAKLIGMTVTEGLRASKQCVSEIKEDGYIAEAKSEVIDGICSVRRFIGEKCTDANGNSYSEIIDNPGF